MSEADFLPAPHKARKKNKKDFCGGKVDRPHIFDAFTTRYGRCATEPPKFSSPWWDGCRHYRECSRCGKVGAKVAFADCPARKVAD